MPEVGVSRRSSSSMGGPSKPGPGSAAKPKKGLKQPQQGQETPSSSSSGVVFAGHENYIAAMAKSCRDNQKFTDVKIQCEDGEIRAHRLVLGAHSCFLREMFLDLPEGMQEYTLIIPQAKTKTVSILIDFLYTGKMILHRNNSSDLQKLVSVLKIDPENVRIEAVDGIPSSNTPGPKTPKNGTKPQGKKLVQQTIGASVLRMRDPGNNANKGLHRLATEYVPSEAQVYEQSPTPPKTKYHQRLILISQSQSKTIMTSSVLDGLWEDLFDPMPDFVDPNEIHQNLPIKVEPAEAVDPYEIPEAVTSTKDDILENAMGAAEIPVHAIQPKVLIQAPPPQQPPKVLIVQPGKRVLRKKKMTDTVNEEEEKAVQTPRKKFKSSGRPVMYNLPPQKDDEMDKKRRDAMNARMNRERKKKEFEALTQTVQMRTAENDKLWSFLEVKGLTDEAIGYMNNH